MRRRALAAVALAAALAAPAPARAQAPVGVPVGLNDAIRLALERNLDLSIERLNPMIARQQAREARGAFDPIMGAGVNYARVERFLNNVLESQARSGIVQDNILTLDYPSFAGKFVTGTMYTVGLTTPIVQTNNPLRLYDEAYQPVLSFGLTQPLLRDFGIEVNTIKIKQAEKAEAQGTLAVEARMLAVIREVETRYWNVFYAQQHVVVTEGMLALAEDLVERTTRAKDAGLATALDLADAKTTVEIRRSEIARARAELIAAQGQLRLLVDPSASVGAAAALVVTERPPETPEPGDLVGKVARALAARPEIRQQELAVERLALEERLAVNGTQWRLDGVGSLGWNGLAGTGVSQQIQGSLPSRLRGQESYGDSFRGFFSPDGNANWSLGVRLQIPIGNNEAQGRLGQVRLARKQEELRLSLVKSQIGVDVETAYQDVLAALARRAAAREAVALAKQQLDGYERDLAAGRSTARKVLEAQDALARAQDSENRALVDAASSRARLEAADAASFDTYRLVIQR